MPPVVGGAEGRPVSREPGPTPFGAIIRAGSVDGGAVTQKEIGVTDNFPTCTTPDAARPPMIRSKYAGPGRRGTPPAASGAPTVIEPTVAAEPEGIATVPVVAEGVP